MSEIEKELDEAGEIEKEQIDNAEELEQKKRNLNEFNVKDNNAEIQIFVQNWNNYLEKEKTIKSSHRDSKTYQLENVKDCVEFIEKCQRKEYLLAALVLCIFEIVPLSAISNLMTQLAVYVYKNETNANEKEKNLYLSMDSILTAIGAEGFLVEGKRKYVGFEKKSNRILENICEQFPKLREAIVLWILDFNDVYRENMDFQDCQLGMAFEKIIFLDIFDAKIKIFPRLYENPKNMELLGYLVYRLYCNDDLKKEADNIVKQWIRSDSKWLWKSACLTYNYLLEEGDIFPLKEQLKKKILIRLRYFERSDYMFFVTWLWKSKYIRSLLSSVLHEFYTTEISAGDEGQIYLNIIRRCYYRMNFKLIEIPLVCCDTEMQQNLLTPIINKIMRNYYLRRQLYAILEVYLKELLSCKVNPKTINHISAYFYNMSLAGKEYELDILELLKDCDNKISEQIINNLQKIYTEEEY